MSPAEHHENKLHGLPVVGIDNRQRSIHGVCGPKSGAYVAVEVTIHRLCIRRRWIHARFVHRDWIF